MKSRRSLEKVPHFVPLVLFWQVLPRGPTTWKMATLEQQFAKNVVNALYQGQRD